QTIASMFVLAAPENPFGFQVERGQSLRRGDVQASGLRARGDAFDGLWLLAGAHLERRNAFHKPVAVADVVHEDANAPVLDVIPDARNGDVKQVTPARIGLQ